MLHHNCKQGISEGLIRYWTSPNGEPRIGVMYTDNLACGPRP